MKRTKLSMFDDDDDGEDDARRGKKAGRKKSKKAKSVERNLEEDAFTVNSEYARRFQYNKEREELQRLTEKHGDVAVGNGKDDGNDSENDSEDDEVEDSKPSKGSDYGAEHFHGKYTTCISKFSKCLQITAF